MNASMPIRHTQAESDLFDRFEAAKPDLSGSVAVSALREAAVDQIRDRGLPHRRVEEYKYSDLRAFMKSAAQLVSKADLANARELCARLLGRFPLACLPCRRLSWLI